MVRWGGKSRRICRLRRGLAREVSGSVLFFIVCACLGVEEYSGLHTCELGDNGFSNGLRGSRYYADEAILLSSAC